MGCGRKISCLDCKKTYYVGYGCYSTWADVWDGDNVTLAAYDKWAEKHPNDVTLLKNTLTRQVLSKHDGHKIEVYSEDYTTLDKESGHLYLSSLHCHEILIPDAATFEFIDLNPDD